MLRKERNRMSPAETEVDFDVKQWLNAVFPGLVREEDSEVWKLVSERIGYRRAALKDLVRAVGVDERWKAWAVLAQILPAVLLPFPWPEGKHRYREIFTRCQFGSVPVRIQRLKFELLCALMEALPQSTQFDLSDDPVALQLPYLNGLVLGYLIEITPNQAGRFGTLVISLTRRVKWLNRWANGFFVKPRKLIPPKWLDQDRAFGCYRLQGSDKPNPKPAGLFYCFNHNILQRGRGSNHELKLKAIRKMQWMIQQELSGNTDCAGALGGYLAAIREWVNWPDEAPTPYDREIAVPLMEFLVDLDFPIGRRIPTDLIYGGGYGFLDLFSGRKAFVEELGRHYLIAEPLAEGNSGTKLALARAIVKVSDDAELLAIAKPLVEEAIERNQPTAKDLAARQAAQTAEEDAQKEDQRILELLK
jgi:hypothetical protein